MKLTKEQIKRIEMHREEGIVNTLIIRKISGAITACLAGTKISPLAVSISSFIIGLATAFFLALGEWKYLIIGGILVLFSYTLDNVDGEIARLRGMVTKKGGWLDTLFDRIKEGTLFFGICFGLYSQTHNSAIWMYGFIAVISVYMSEIVPNITALQLEKSTLKKTHSNLFLTKIIKKLKIKQSFLSLGIDVRLFIIALGAILNQLMLVLWFFMIVQNLYWIAMMLLVGIRKDAGFAK